MKKITCIIVDDEKEARDRLEHLLKMLDDIEILEKEGNSGIAVKKITELKPDIAFLDIEMPGKSGLEIVEEVRANHIFPTFIFVTGYNQYTLKAIKKAAFDYLLKPVDIDELRETIERFKKQSLAISSENTDNNIYNLSDREKEIIKLIVQGKTSKEIGEQLFLSKHTVDDYRRKILEKTDLKSSTQLVDFAHKNNLI